MLVEKQEEKISRAHAMKEMPLKIFSSPGNLNIVKIWKTQFLQQGAQLP